MDVVNLEGNEMGPERDSQVRTGIGAAPAANPLYAVFKARYDRLLALQAVCSAMRDSAHMRGRRRLIAHALESTARDLVQLGGERVV